MKLHFIIIDDSQLDCFIAEKLILHNYADAGIEIFTEAVTAMAYLRNRTYPTGHLKNIIILDILMPLVNGLDFLEEFETLPEHIRAEYLIVAITSSLNKAETSKVYRCKFVKHLVGKPITSESLRLLMENELFTHP